MPHYRVKKVPAYCMADTTRDVKGKGRLAQKRLHCRGAHLLLSHLG